MLLSSRFEQLFLFIEDKLWHLREQVLFIVVKGVKRETQYLKYSLCQ